MGNSCLEYHSATHLISLFLKFTRPVAGVPLHVHRKGESGSRRVKGSTNLSNARIVARRTPATPPPWCLPPPTTDGCVH
jgi:hypothetical protein